MAEEFDTPNDDLELDNDSAVEIEIVDDTPEHDRGREPLVLDEDPEQETELNSLAKDTKKRINQLTHRYHDERREKERLEIGRAHV